MIALWVKSFHIISVVTWFAALFYLPRLYVYHAMARDKGDTTSMETFKVMERKLYRGIMTPSMIVVLIFGILMLYLKSSWMSQGWMHTKLLLVALLIAYHQSIYC